jgi:hypothetical protein
MFSLVKISLLVAGVAAAQEATYAHRIFHDFRSLNKCRHSGEPANITNDEESAAAPVQSGYLTSNAFVSDFGIQTWGSPVSEDSRVGKLHSNQNVYIGKFYNLSHAH